jgi:hypothetical protein
VGGGGRVGVVVRVGVIVRVGVVVRVSGSGLGLGVGSWLWLWLGVGLGGRAAGGYRRDRGRDVQVPGDLAAAGLGGLA